MPGHGHRSQPKSGEDIAVEIQYDGGPGLVFSGPWKIMVHSIHCSGDILMMEMIFPCFSNLILLLCGYFDESLRQSCK